MQEARKPSREATPINQSALLDRLGKTFASLAQQTGRFFLGRPLANRESGKSKIGVIEGVPAMGLDGLASSAYGPEAALSVLVSAGAAALSYLVPTMLVILGLLAMLCISYWQTIEAYPTNGGAYTVAKENLGVTASLVAAAALMIDYVLNVAVGISAGVAALVSAVPALHPFTLPLCLSILAVITLANLRGTMDAGRLFALPTYTFVASFVIILLLGTFSAIANGGHPHPLEAPPRLPQTTGAIGLWLLLRTFASGCTAMTGVEAVSNGVSAFREPRVKYGHRTLVSIVGTLGILLGGIAYLASAYGIMAMDQTQPGYQSVLSQLAGAVVGRGAFYYLAIASVLCILCLSANTSFVDFPRLCRLVAQDSFLPHAFTHVGRRLVYSVGVLYLALTAGLLLTIFGGITDRLIPLFAVGAFLTFTMSQAGMVAHWRKQYEGGRQAPSGRVRVHLAINGLGAMATGIALIVIVAAKFAEGAWITVLTIPCVVLLLKVIKRYYDDIRDHLREQGPLEFHRAHPPLILVATQEWNRLTDKALGLALELSSDVIAVHLAALEGADVEAQEEELRARWTADVERPALAAHRRPPQLVFLNAPYRHLHAPLLKFIRTLEDRHPDRTIAVLIPELVRRHWWEYFLHSRRAAGLRSALLEYGGSHVVVIVVPWHLTEPRIEEAMSPEEVAEPLDAAAS